MAIKSKARHDLTLRSIKREIAAIHGCFLDLTKTCHLGNAPVMVRNAGELPQPFWLGAACGGGSRSAARCAARA